MAVSGQRFNVRIFYFISPVYYHTVYITNYKFAYEKHMKQVKNGSRMRMQLHEGLVSIFLLLFLNERNYCAYKKNFVVLEASLL